MPSMKVDAREQRGADIAKVAVVARKDAGSWLVPSMSGNGRYVVKVDGEKPSCTCPDCAQNGFKCKHIFAVEFTMKRETTRHADGTTTVTETVEIKATARKTYRQNWPAYNEAQTNEKHEFQSILFDLCKSIPTPEQTGRGQRRLPMADAVFSVVFKVYSTFSGRRFMCDLEDAKEKGYIDEAPHYNSIFNYLETPELTPVLESLIAESAKPLASVESDFSVDSTGFSSSRFVRWFDQKYGTVRQEHTWVKAHFCCGTKTNVVTAVEIYEKNTNDTPILPSLVDKTAENFTMKEISADKAYATQDNFAAIERAGATPYVMFKSSHTGKSGGLLAKAFHFFCFKQDEFLAHYHKRSNIESTVSMVKAKFRDHVRSKTDIAMKNEVLCKFLCHNICCLISAFYELGIVPMFLPNGTVGCPTGSVN